MPNKQVSAWEAAYRVYRDASDADARSRGANPDVAREMAAASRSVAQAWRALAGDPDLPWWVVAAVGSAAQAFEDQARQWERKAGGDEYAGGVRPDVGDQPVGRGDGGGDWFGSGVAPGAGAVGHSGIADDPSSRTSGRLAEPGRLPSPTPRLRGRTGGTARKPRTDRGL